MSLRFRVIQPPRLRAIVARGVAGPPGESAESAPIPASRMLANFGATLGPAIAVDSNQVIAWLDVPTNFAFGALSSTVIGLAGDLVYLETLVNTKVDSNDSRLTNAREWIASTVSQAEAEAGTATARRAWTAERVRQAAEALNVERGVYDRAGYIYDHPEGNRALECSDSEWIFGSTLQRDNLLVALSAVPKFLTMVTGGVNNFDVTPPADVNDFARFWFSSHSGPSNDNFGTVQILAGPEEGIILLAQQNGAGVQQYSISISPSGFYVEGRSDFRRAIEAIGNTFETVNNNLQSLPHAINQTSGRITSIVYTFPNASTITKTINYTSDRVTSIVLSGATPSGISLTKTFTYTGNDLTGVSYS